MFIGEFNDPMVGAWFYDLYVKKYWDGDGSLNFPDGPTVELEDKLELHRLNKITRSFGVQQLKSGRWKVLCQRKYVGTYTTKLEAQLVYDSKVMELELDKELNFDYDKNGNWKLKEFNPYVSII